ncbi:hypothetical protein [Pedobacter sp. GR22-6]|uniref:hypothetical protein n=1 Tax=Pedobacter sp. GR22-6 TaxID=3127957 RepID=UPI00307EC785
MMLRVLSYLNIGFALLYFILYLLNSVSLTICAILLVIVHNGWVLRAVQQDLKLTAMHYILALTNLVFAGFLMTWLVSIFRSSLEYNYFANTWLYMLISALFVIGILCQLLAMLLRRS